MTNLTQLSRRVSQIGTYGAIVLILACSVSVDSEGETQSQALIDRLPSGATAIAWIDFEALAAAMPPERWDEYEQMLQDDENAQDVERFEEATGIDLREDLRQMGVALMPGAAEEDHPIVLISADFERDRFESLLTEAGTIEYEGTTMYVLEDFVQNLEVAVGRSEGGDSAEVGVELASENEAYIAVLDSSTVAIGTEGGLRVVVDVDAGRHDNLKSDPAMNELISDVAGRGQIWFVATKPTWDDQVANLDDADTGGMVPTTVIESIETATMSMRWGDGLSMTVSGITGSAEDASMLTQSLNGIISMGKMMVQGSDPQLFEILDRGVRAAQDDRTISIEVTLTEADIEYLQRMAEEQGESAVIGS